ncbi:MAG: 50S ribosomal protein L11 methyltransferase [Alphaproteobacteria bacterium]
MPHPAVDTWCIEMVTSPAALPAFEAALEPLADALATSEIEEGPDQGGWRIEAVCREAPDPVQVATRLAVAAAAAGVPDPAIRITRLSPRDWVRENLTSFPPIAVGRFFIHGSHFEGRTPATRLPLLIDAGTAFGSGEHQSTRGCLAALDRLARQRRVRRPLDMGCGSGILALAIARAWRVPVVAADIDPDAVVVTAFNARGNGLKGLVRAMEGDGFKARAVRAAGPYDLIVANILARPLARMAHRLCASLRPGGTVILSGLLVRQERQILAAFRPQGLRLEHRVVIEPWITLVLRAAAEEINKKC